MSSNSGSSDRQNVSIDITNLNFSTIKIISNHVRINVINMNNSIVEVIGRKVDSSVINSNEKVTQTKAEDHHVGQPQQSVPQTVEDKEHHDAKSKSKIFSNVASSSSSWGVRMSRSSFNRKQSVRQYSNSEKL